MMCGLYELGLTSGTFPTPPLLLPLFWETTSLWTRISPPLPADIQAGDKIYGPWFAPECWSAFPSPTAFSTPVWIWAAPPPALIRYAPTSTRATSWPTTPRRTPSAPLEDLHAQQAEFPTASATAFSSSARTASPATISSPSSVRTIMWWNLRLLPTAPDCLSVIGLAREAAATFDAELHLHEPVVKGGAPGNLAELLDVETPAADLCPRYTARMVRNVKNRSLPQMDARTPPEHGRAPHQQHRGHHQLCHAGIRSTHARLLITVM